MLTDDEARDAIRDFQAAIDRLVIDVAIALKPWAESTQHALTAAFTPFFERLRDDYPEAFDEDGVLRQMSTDYSALTEREKESDRHQSDKILVILQEKRRKANP